MENSAERRFQIILPILFSRHYEVRDPHSQNTYFYVDISTLTPGKPDLTMHLGLNDAAPIVAVSHLPKFTGEFKIGLGDPAQHGPNGIKWESMLKTTMFPASPKHCFSMNLPGANYKNPYDESAQQGMSRPGDRHRREFVWKRTHSAGGLSSLSSGNYKLQDMSTNEVVALFTRDGGFTRDATLQIGRDLGRDFDLMVLMSCLSLNEKARRAKRANRNRGSSSSSLFGGGTVGDDF